MGEKGFEYVKTCLVSFMNEPLGLKYELLLQMLNIEHIRACFTTDILVLNWEISLDFCLIFGCFFGNLWQAQHQQREHLSFVFNIFFIFFDQQKRTSRRVCVCVAFWVGLMPIRRKVMFVWTQMFFSRKRTFRECKFSVILKKKGHGQI